MLRNALSNTNCQVQLGLYALQNCRGSVGRRDEDRRGVATRCFFSLTRISFVRNSNSCWGLGKEGRRG